MVVAAEDAGKASYALLARAMRESGYMALAQLTMHNQRVHGVSAAILRMGWRCTRCTTPTKCDRWNTSAPKSPQVKESRAESSASV